MGTRIAAVKATRGCCTNACGYILWRRICPMRRTLFAVIVAVLLGLTIAESASAAEQTPDDILVAMASF